MSARPPRPASPSTIATPSALAAPRVAEVQEQHAQLCERLTVARCRITGMRYRVVNDRDIEAMLAFKLDPAIARHFGRDGVEAVIRAEGMLTESEISGTDVGTGIRHAGRTIAQLNEELRRIEARLAGAASPPTSAAGSRYEAQQLRQPIRAAEANREEQQETLATTPMVFNYGSGDLVPGFDDRPTFAKAWDQRAGQSGRAGLRASSSAGDAGALDPARPAALVGRTSHPPPLVRQGADRGGRGAAATA